MSEEKRIIEHNGYFLYQQKTNQKWYFGTSEDSNGTFEDNEPTPISKSDLKDIMFLDFDGNTNNLISLIGINRLWNKYGKPVPEKKWYVKVPHTYPSSWYQIGQCNDSTMIITNIECVPNDSFKFTDSEIKKYHLEDCEKVPADD
ncbi:hypothetical protein OZX58_03220 [Lactobacillus sp. ESL0680]|uniref:hypothetical protein n=1 Tax=Lactobacillus sp. ESL0680 TaxID=2983210 RepID=UPI0023F6A5A3|nr:hypothetical protein [Lactobacillus sp. ESL0680]WEV39261.1 hypothetical protein OZX58_03220 [Lactobacillus sp. ESL0680]